MMMILERLLSSSCTNQNTQSILSQLLKGGGGVEVVSCKILFVVSCLASSLGVQGVARVPGTMGDRPMAWHE